MPNAILDEGVVSFKSEGRLLQELGLRLVASPEVALVELVKNAYDADSVDCKVHVVDDGKALKVEDHGHGMTLNDFKNKWMQIATSSKLGARLSARFKRPLTGAKGIGRFAVRYLGDELELESTAFDGAKGYLTILKAVFRWHDLDAQSDLARTTVPYQLLKAPDGASTGTTLTIRKLRSTTDFARSRTLKANVLRIVSPLEALEKGQFNRRVGEGQTDPGFSVLLPGDQPSEDANLADLVLKHYWARLTISLHGRELKFTVTFPNKRKPHELAIKVRCHIEKGFFADIRFFPRRKGVFQGKEVNGRTAWSWVRANSGVAVVDHGFRIKPYGFPDDDWLWLDLDKAHNERDWRTDIAKEHFPTPDEIRAREAENPALYLPHSNQLVGAVFVETMRVAESTEEHDLIPAMDREGLLGNAGFDQLREYVRAGIEYLALCDKNEVNRLVEAQAKAAALAAREDIRKAIDRIEETPTLTSAEKSRLVKEYSELANRLEEQEEYSARSRQSLLTMSLLGVVAGFMTHECDAMFHDLQQTARDVENLAKKNPSLKPMAQDLARRLELFAGYLEYSRLFIKKVRQDDVASFSVTGQIRHLMNRFQPFANERGIKVTCEVARDAASPAVPLTAYSGILLNLYTNALKALIAVEASVKDPRVVFHAWNEDSKHIVEVLDNGVGIPPELRKRIWDPLYTTTARPGNPLGSGMGLGLTLVKQVVTEIGGTISLMSGAPKGFTTCFRVVYPMA
ncbi:MAG TPA: sensor histidine kinase [Gemmataceae bacterium]|nr:sensor histidine kinase [Gemmataceae bacterium]